VIVYGEMFNTNTDRWVVLRFTVTTDEDGYKVQVLGDNDTKGDPCVHLRFTPDQAALLFASFVSPVEQ
jgi:hypothetical protein